VFFHKYGLLTPRLHAGCRLKPDKPHMY